MCKQNCKCVTKCVSCKCSEIDNLKFMAEAFKAKITEEINNYIRFEFKTYCDATKFIDFLRTKEYHTSAIVGKGVGCWQIVVWNY